MTEVIMPKMGDGMEEGTLLAWKKKDGDKVQSGEIIAEIQTDKATAELEAERAGVLSGLLIKEGDTVPVGQPIAALLKDGEELPKGWGAEGGSGQSEGGSATEEAKSTKSEGGNGKEATESEKKEEPESEPKDEKSTVRQSAMQDARIKASPLARRIAEEAGVELSSIEGSGPGGRIVEDDVRQAIKQQGSRIEAPTGEDRKVELNKIRQITAKLTAHSKANVPHFYVTVQVDLDRIMVIRDLMEEEESGKLSVNDFAVRACVMALLDMPEVNAEFKGDHILVHGDINVGLAVALDDGLTLPVLRAAQGLTMREISERTRELVERARSNKLPPEDLQGATFSISNMGMLDVDNFSAIIVEPNAAIVAISSARKAPYVDEEGEVAVGWRMNVTGSFDHRVVDGAVAARFMNLVRDYLEAPTHLIS